jgi:hypothetical protein
MYTNLMLGTAEGLWDFTTLSGSLLEALFVGNFKFTEACYHWGFWYADSLTRVPAPRAI